MKLSAWDRFTGALAPKWTLSRVRARMALEVTARHYEAAQPGRRTDGWQRNFGDADLNARAALSELRMHARDLIRNNAWARKAQRVIANNTVGWGILPKAGGPAASQAEALWKAWAASVECESEGRHNFYGLQALAMKSVAETGEVLFRRRPRLVKDNLTIPLQIQVLEADYLDHSKNLLESDAGGPIIAGVEFDKIGRRAAYWIFDRHPGSGRNYAPSKRIGASEIIHVYYTERPGQTRGVSWFAPAILTLKDLDEYEDATLLKQKIAACFGAFVTDMDGFALGDTSVATASQPLLEELQPGTVGYLAPGKDVKFANPPSVTEEGYSVRNLRKIAAGIGVTYEDMTGDYSQVNFSSARMARISHQQNVNDWRWNMLIPLLCDGVWGWAMEAAISSGELPEGDIPSVQWTPPPLPMLEPDKEGLAYSRLIRNGLMTLSEAMREQGQDPDAQFAQIAADNAKLDDLEIILDCDPRETTAAGMLQIEPPDPSAATDGPPAKPPAKKKAP